MQFLSEFGTCERSGVGFWAQRRLLLQRHADMSRKERGEAREEWRYEFGLEGAERGEQFGAQCAVRRQCAHCSPIRSLASLYPLPSVSVLVSHTHSLALTGNCRSAALVCCLRPHSSLSFHTPPPLKRRFNLRFWFDICRCCCQFLFRNFIVIILSKTANPPSFF